MASQRHSQPPARESKPKDVPTWLRLWCLTAGVEWPIPEHRFCPGRRFAFDFAWPARMWAVEIEGGLYGRGKRCPTCNRRSVGAHTSIQRLKDDLEKYNLAAVLGWTLIRVQPEECESGAALKWLDELLTM